MWKRWVIFFCLSGLYWFLKVIRKPDSVLCSWSVTFPWGSVVFTDCALSQFPSPPCFTRSSFLGTCCAALPPGISFAVCRRICSTKQFLVSQERISTVDRFLGMKCKLYTSTFTSDFNSSKSGILGSYVRCCAVGTQPMWQQMSGFKDKPAAVVTSCALLFHFNRN